MGTIINGNKWIGACVNGNVVSGLVKNGIIFYKKNQQELYKRRIMVGDNLKGKNIYSVFPENHWNNMEVSYGTNNYIISLENSDYGIYEILIIGSMDDIYRVTSFGISDEYLYDYDVDSGTEDQNNSSFDSNSDYIVSSVMQVNSSYRCLYIEDPNIRPLQSTDLITKNTKFYFNFPDNLYEELIEYYYEIESDIFMIINNKNNDNMTFQVAYSPDVFFTISVHSRIGMEKSITDIYAYNEYTDFINESKLFFTETILNKYEGENFIITELDTNSPIYKYILVDTTTLGN